jgi:anti-sigma regulatory factor (Ser/Thr protein kinase)
VDIKESLNLRLSGGPKAPGRARKALGSLDGTLSDLRGDVDLLVSELVSNAVLHAHADHIELHADADPEGVRVEVFDPGPGFDQRDRTRAPAIGDEGGYGLVLVEQLADRWGVRRDRRTSVWFEIDRDHEPAVAADR